MKSYLITKMETKFLFTKVELNTLSLFSSLIHSTISTILVTMRGQLRLAKSDGKIAAPAT